MLNGNELMLGDYVNIADYDLPEAVGVVEEIYANGKEMYISIDGQAYDILSDKYISVLFLSKIAEISIWGASKRIKSRLFEVLTDFKLDKK